MAKPKSYVDQLRGRPPVKGYTSEQAAELEDFPGWAHFVPIARRGGRRDGKDEHEHPGGHCERSHVRERP